MDDKDILAVCDEPVLKEFDDFFVGGGSTSLLRCRQPVDYTSLVGKADGPVVEVKPDLARFATDRQELADSEYEAVYMAGKYEAYAVFGYLKIKSETLGTVMSESELLVGDDDKYYVEGLRGLTHDRHAVYALATLAAYREMGVRAVRFRQRHDCGLCRALDGLLVTVDDAISAFGYGHGIVHGYCDCRLVPVIDRRVSYGPLDAALNTEQSDVGDLVVFNMPVELAADLRPLLAKVTGVVSIDFLDLEKYLKREGCVVCEEDSVLLVHNNYCYGKDPADYLRAWLTTDDESCPALDGPVVYYKGRRVVYAAGFYWDVERKEKVL